jgi:DNA (cytosine-5)-methyltransferase 1
MGTGRNNIAMVIEPSLWAICSESSNSMKSSNPHSGIYKCKTSRTILTGASGNSCNQGQMFVLQGSMIGRKNKNGPQGNGIQLDKTYTLNTVDKHAVAYSESFGNNGFAKWDKNPATLKASGGELGGGSENLVVENKYIVRRLIPLECSRLQGFPDFWCQNLENENPTVEEIQEWDLIFKKFGKPKTKNQITKWLKNPYSDCAQYKMWGNGVALPCVSFVLSKIRAFLLSETDNKWRK